MSDNLLTPAVSCHLAHTIRIGNTQDLARLQTIHVVRFKRRPITLEKGHQHLLHGNPFGSVLHGYSIEGVARPYNISPACSRRCGDGGSRRSRSGTPHRSRIRTHTILIGTNFRRSYCNGCTIRTDIRRIKQEGVFANKATRRPVELHQHVDKGLIDGAIAGDFYNRTAPPTLDRHAQAVHRGRIIDPRLPKSLRRREPRRHVLYFFRCGGDFKLCAQRLPKAAEDSDPPKPCRTGTKRHSADGSSKQGAF